MSSLPNQSDAFRDDRNAAVIRIAAESGAMLGLVEGCPEFERLAFILERARSEAVRILTLHGLSLPPAVVSEPSGRELPGPKGFPEA